MLERWELIAGSLEPDYTFRMAGDTWVEIDGDDTPAPVWRSKVRRRGLDHRGKVDPSRIQVECEGHKCGAHYVLRLDRIVTVFEERARAGQAKSNGWVDVHTGEF